MVENKVSIRELKRSLSKECSARQREFIQSHIRQKRSVRFFQISIFFTFLAVFQVLQCVFLIFQVFQ